MHFINSKLVSIVDSKTKKDQDMKELQLLCDNDYTFIHKIVGEVVFSMESIFNGKPIIRTRIMTSSGRKMFMTDYCDTNMVKQTVGKEITVYGKPVSYEQNGRNHIAFNNVDETTYQTLPSDCQIKTVNDYGNNKNWEKGEVELPISYIPWKNGGGISYNIARSTEQIQ